MILILTLIHFSVDIDYIDECDKEHHMSDLTTSNTEWKYNMSVYLNCFRDA